MLKSDWIEAQQQSRKRRLDSPIPSHSHTHNTHITAESDLNFSQPISVEMGDNIKSATLFGREFYHTTKSEKSILSKGGKYILPSKVAFSKRKDGEFVIEVQSLSSNKKFVYRHYGCLTLEQIRSLAWGKDQHFLEVIGETEPRKLYFDIDYYLESEDNTHKIVSALKDLLFTIDLGVPIEEEDLAICMGEGTNTDGQLKKSFHIVVNNIHFSNFEDMKKALNYIKRQVYENDKYMVLRTGSNGKEILDFAVYKSQQVFKLPYQSKAKSSTNIIQIPVGECKLEDFLLTHTNGAGRMYNLSHLPAPKQVVKKITCPSQKSKRIEVNWEESVVLQSLKERIPADFKSPMSNEKKPIGNSMDALRYYVKSVPNPVGSCSCGQGAGRKVKSALSYCISRITKNSDEGFEILWDWLNNEKLSKEKEKSLYMKNRTDYGYGWSFLYKLALMYNPRVGGGYNDILDQLFNDKATFPVKSQVINSRYIDHEHFSMEKSIDNNKVLFIKSPMGTGKSYSFRQVFDSSKYKSVCYLSCKRAFASSMTAEFCDYGFVNYDEVCPKENISKEDRIICSVESAHYLRNAYDLVVIDESESICDNLTGGMIQKNAPVENITSIYSIIRHSSKVVVMDAYLTTRSFDMIRMINEKKKEECLYLKNEFKFEPRFAEVLGGKNGKKKFNAKLKSKLLEGKRCVVVMGGKQYSEDIEEMLKTEGITYKLHNSRDKNKLPPNANVNSIWSGVQCLIYTPTITAGISYTNPDWVFDHLFIYCVNAGSCHIRDTIQAHRRVRNFASKNVYVCVNDNYRGHDASSMPMVKSECEEYYSHFKALLYGVDVNDLKKESETSWVYPIFIHNKIEINIAKIFCRKLLLRYLKYENIRILNESDDGELNLEQSQTEFKFDELDTLTADEYADLDDRVNDTSFDKEHLTDEEWGIYIKMKYGLEHINPDITPDTCKKFFDNYYSNPQTRRHFKNIRDFMKLWDDSKKQWEAFDPNVFINEGDIPVELRSADLKRTALIGKFFTHTKLLSQGEPIYQCVNREFWLEDLNSLRDWCNDINLVPSINNLLTNHKIRPHDKIKDTPKGIKAIFENLLKEHWGCELESSDKQVYVEKDGKKKKTRKTKCKIVKMAQGLILPSTEDSPNEDRNGLEDLKNGVNRQDPVFHPFNVFRNTYTDEFGEKYVNEDFYKECADSPEPKSNESSHFLDTSDEEEVGVEYPKTDWGKYATHSNEGDGYEELEKLKERKLKETIEKGWNSFREAKKLGKTDKSRCVECGKPTLLTKCVGCLFKE